MELVVRLGRTPSMLTALALQVLVLVGVNGMHPSVLFSSERGLCNAVYIGLQAPRIQFWRMLLQGKGPECFFVRVQDTHGTHKGDCQN